MASPFSSEVNKGNVQMLYKPNHYVSITTGHQNILEPVTMDGPMQQASVNQLSTDFHVNRFYFGTGLFSSNAAGRKASGEICMWGAVSARELTLTRIIFRASRRCREVLRSRRQASSQERCGKISLRASACCNSFRALRDRLRSLSEATSPVIAFNSARITRMCICHFGRTVPFQQALALNVMVRVRGPLQVMAVSNVAPDGHLRYSFGASTYLYRLSGMAGRGLPEESFSIGKYVIQGVVKDEKGMPIEGAALHVGREIAYTDSSGHFQVRLSKHGPYALVSCAR